jgi:hypothetical protein
VVWVGFLEEPLKEVHGRPRLTLVTVCGGRGAPPAGAASIPVVAVIMVSCGRCPLKVLLAPIFITLDTLPADVDGDVGWRSLITAQGRLPASLGLVKHNRLIAGGVLGGDAAWCLECVPAKVAMLTLERAPCAALGLHARTPQVSLAVGLWLDVPALSPQRGLR